MIAILSDIHGNWEALQAVLEVCERLRVQRYICLGDVIGYGPDPLAVSRVARERFAISLLGNHEEALITGKHRFNPHAAQAIDWTRAQLKRERELWQWYLERQPFAISDQMLCVHGSIYDPVHDYVDEPENPIEAQQMIETLNRDFSGFDVCFAGHNHTPFLATTVGVIVPHDGHRQFRLPKGHKAYICVGSVGQPRDRDPRASFATLDGEALTFHRVPYDVATTQAKILRAGLNPFLAERLAEGI
ncbi:MAG: metallophosphoesterase family protein [Planctomycetota bacterium]|nr:metallophosphoesterase family protein [Planctomycetota bacterium]MDW8372095.1 metallophosphoesterase family protein [Planctomycetota bacterium]